MEDYYEILGLSREASPEVINKAYKELLKKHHPNNPENRSSQNKKKEAEAMMMKINKAYDVLKNPAQRDAYDQQHPPKQQEQQQQQHEDDHQVEEQHEGDHEEEEEPEIFLFKSRNADEMFKKFFPSAAAAATI